MDLGKYNPDDIVSEILERRSAAKSLHEFLKQAWYWMEGTDSFADNWHIEAIAEHLEAVFRGEIKRLLINQPPRTCKTNLVSVAFPAWCWIHKPELRFLFASYGADISMDSSTKCRSLIESAWYQARWGGAFSLDSSQNTKTRFDNSKKGYRIATSVGGAMTGFGGDILIGDDLNSTNDTSETMLESTGNWFTRTFSTRLNSLKAGRIIIVQQRVHEDDVSGRLLANDEGEWTKLILPMEYERDRRCITVPLPSTGGEKWSDPRKIEGELLWPEHIGSKELNLLKAAFHHNEYTIAGQLQQRPAPLEGGIIKRSWFKLWPTGKLFPGFDYIIQSYDTAFTEKASNDPSACTTWGIFKEEGRWSVLLLDCWEERLEYPELRRKAIEEASALYGDPPSGVDMVLIEDKASGIILKTDMAQAGLPVKVYNPGRADKVQRTHMISHLIEGGMVYLPESGKEDRRGRPMTWCEPFLEQVSMFPNARHDDMHDTMVQALIMLKDMRFLEGGSVPREEEDEEEPWDRDSNINPYAM